MCKDNRESVISITNSDYKLYRNFWENSEVISVLQMATLAVPEETFCANGDMVDSDSDDDEERLVIANYFVIHLLIKVNEDLQFRHR